MGGMPVCTAAGAAAMKLIEDEDLVHQAVAKGQQIRQALTDARVPCIKEIRGAGLLIGIEIDKPAGEIFKAALEAGIFICYSGTGVLRLAPPLIVDDATLAQGVEILVGVLKK